MLKCVTYNNKGFSFTGSKVLKLIAAKNIPGIDLYVRETMQNSSDAILKDAPYGLVEYTIGKFNTSKLANQFEKISDKIIELNEEKSNFIAIQDKNTTGLLGDYLKETPGDKNLYNLLYEIMEGKGDSLLGGGHGIGKTISSKFGNGITIYYSRTYENGKYYHKLAATIVENEKESNRLLTFAKDGIGYFGDYDELNKCAKPIYDEKVIKDFLSIFNISIYSGEETGTITLIPFYDESKFLEYYLHQDKPVWNNNLELALEYAVQRWYFPRIDNDKFNGKKLQVRINGRRIKLNQFFLKLQNLYNGSEKGCFCYPVQKQSLSKDEYIGNFYYKKFSATELGIGVPPENLQSPYMLLDINSSGSVNNAPIFFYTRKPGMIINYKDNFTRIGEDELDYLIGVFVLNDEFKYCGENLSDYFKGTEVANHNEWTDSNVEECPNLSSKKPFKILANEITSKIKSLYCKNDDIVVSTSIDKLRRILGQKLLPPEDFGNSPTPTGPPKDPKDPISKRKIICKFDGFDVDGLVRYTFNVRMSKNEFINTSIIIDSKVSKYSLHEWREMGFSLPVKFSNLFIKKILFKNDDDKQYKERFVNDSLENLDNNQFNNLEIFNEKILSYKGIVIDDGKVEGFVLKNTIYDSLAIEAEIYIKPIDLTSSIGITYSINKEK